MHIFCADDDRIMRMLTTAQIELAGHTATAFSDGQYLLEALETTNETVGCILLDREMEIMGGIETLIALKENPDTAAIPVFILTGDAMAIHKQEALDAGAADYLIKPVDPDMLQQALSRALPTS